MVDIYPESGQLTIDYSCLNDLSESDYFFCKVFFQ